MADLHQKVKRDDMEGSLYGRPPASYDADLIHVGSGTLFGELLRRYWQPFAMSFEITNELPLPIRILGEDLVAFRDGEGNAGLMYPRCMHRGADLLYGKIEPQGIRCPYHGWMFDTTGHLLDTPCELNPNNDALRRIIRQPWYPVIEKFGIAFAYMGPSGKMPMFPRFPVVLESLEEGEKIVASGGSQPARGWPIALNTGEMDYNWFQYFENFMDPLHLTALHLDINGNQFSEDAVGNPDICKFRATSDGAAATWLGIWQSPRDKSIVSQSIFQCVSPNIMLIAPVFGLAVRGLPSIHWTVPVDDTNFRHFSIRLVRKDGDNHEIMKLLRMFQPDWGPGIEKEPYVEWTLEEKQRWQTDYLVQKSLGPINLHSDEHLTKADAGVVAIRRILKQQANIVRNGGDPWGTHPDSAPVIEVFAGTAMLDPESRLPTQGYARWTVEDYK